MPTYTIIISEAQRALLAELLDQNRETILLRQSAQAFGATLLLWFDTASVSDKE